MKKEKFVWTAGVGYGGRWEVLRYPLESDMAKSLLKAAIGFTSEKIATDFMKHVQFIANCLSIGDKNKSVLLLQASYATPVKKTIKKKVIKKVTKKIKPKTKKKK